VKLAMRSQRYRGTLGANIIGRGLTSPSTTVKLSGFVRPDMKTLSTVFLGRVSPFALKCQKISFAFSFTNTVWSTSLALPSISSLVMCADEPPSLMKCASIKMLPDTVSLKLPLDITRTGALLCLPSRYVMSAIASPKTPVISASACAAKNSFMKNYNSQGAS